MDPARGHVRGMLPGGVRRRRSVHRGLHHRGSDRSLLSYSAERPGGFHRPLGQRNPRDTLRTVTSGRPHRSAAGQLFDVTLSGYESGSPKARTTSIIRESGTYFISQAARFEFTGRIECSNRSCLPRDAFPVSGGVRVRPGSGERGVVRGTAPTGPPRGSWLALVAVASGPRRR
jgi:hypothetical protein